MAFYFLLLYLCHRLDFSSDDSLYAHFSVTLIYVTGFPFKWILTTFTLNPDSSRIVSPRLVSSGFVLPLFPL